MRRWFPILKIPLALLAAALLGPACAAAKPDIVSEPAGVSMNSARRPPPLGPEEPEEPGPPDADVRQPRADRSESASPDNAAIELPVEVPEAAAPETVAVVPARYGPSVRIVSLKERSRFRVIGENTLIGAVLGAVIPLAVAGTVTPAGGSDAWSREDWEVIGAATAGGAILGALGGFAYGIFAPLEKESEEPGSLAGASTMIGSFPIQEELSGHVAARAKTQGRRPVVVLGEVGPDSPSGTTDYMPLLARDIGVVVETAVVGIAILSDGPANDSYTASLSGTARRIDTMTGRVEQEEPFEVRLGSLPLSVWEWDGYAALISAIRDRLPDLASRIVDSLVPPPAPAAPSPSDHRPGEPAA